MDDVEAIGVPGQEGIKPAAEGVELAEGTGIVRQPFRQVGPAGEVSGPKGEQGVLFGEKVQRGQADQLDPVIQFRPGRAGGDTDLVAQCRKGGGELADIDTLAADMGVRAIARHQDTQWPDTGRFGLLFRPCGNKGIWAHDA